MGTPINPDIQIITLTTHIMKMNKTHTPVSKEDLSLTQQSDANKSTPLTDTSMQQTNNTIAPTMGMTQSVISQTANPPVPPIPMIDPMYIVNASLVTVFAKVVSDLFRSK